MDWMVVLARWLVIIATPFFLGLGGIRAFIAWDSPDYPSFEYNRIPPDQFGFTPEERLELARATLAYLRRPEPAAEAITLLQELRLPGSDEPLYNEAEISHMIDVKVVADGMKRVVWLTAVIILGGLAFLLARPETRPEAYRTIFHSGLATVIILVGIALFIGLGWSLFFVTFHELLFPPGTWTFQYTDSLIRLFPEQFWFDAGVIMSAIPLVAGVLVTGLGFVLMRRA